MTPRPHPMQAEIEAVRRLHEAGHSARSIGRMTGLAEATARNWILRGFEVRAPNGAKRGLMERERERAERREGAAGEKERRSRLRRLAAERAGSRRRRPAERDRRIRELWAEGATGPELRRRFGLAKGTIAGIVAGIGRPARQGPRSDLAWPYPRVRFEVTAEASAGGGPPPAPLARVRYDAGDRLGGHDGACLGSEHGRAKLDEAAVAEMRRLRALGFTVAELAQRFGVNGNTAGYAISGRTWGHVPGAIRSERGGRS